MGIDIAIAYAEHGVTATEISEGYYSIKGGDTPLVRTSDQNTADDFAFAYTMGKLAGHRAEREKESAK